MTPELLPPATTPQKSTISLANFFLVFLLLVALGLGYYYYRLLQPAPAPSTDSTVAEQSPALGTSTYRLPTGVQTYRFTHGPDVKGPKIQSVVIDPLDPKVGTKQSFTLEITSLSKLSEASLIVQTDQKNKNLNLKFVSGTLASGIYQVSWQVNDSFDSRYSLKYLLTDESGTYDDTMYLR